MHEPNACLVYMANFLLVYPYLFSQRTEYEMNALAWPLYILNKTITGVFLNVQHDEFENRPAKERN